MQSRTEGSDQARAEADGQYQTTDWRVAARAAETAAWKRGIYRVLRPALSWRARRWLSDEARRRWLPQRVLFTRGFPLEHRRAWSVRGIDIASATLLLQGVGTGWEVSSWARLRPKRIVATDLYEFASWNDVARECRDRWRVPVEFRQAPLERHEFLASESVDLCASDAVFEHCRDLASVLAESHRVLRRNGHLAASFGPLWYCPGGDHFSTRGGLTNAYAHIELSPDAYRDFFSAHKRPVEDFQSGGRYVELDLFSKLTADGYFERFRSAGFRVDALMIWLDPLALEFERQFPARWRELVRRLEGVATIDDLRTKGLFVRLRK